MLLASFYTRTLLFFRCLWNIRSLPEVYLWEGVFFSLFIRPSRNLIQNLDCVKHFFFSILLKLKFFIRITKNCVAVENSLKISCKRWIDLIIHLIISDLEWYDQFSRIIPLLILLNFVDSCHPIIDVYTWLSWLAVFIQTWYLEFTI